MSEAVKEVMVLRQAAIDLQREQERDRLALAIRIAGEIGGPGPDDRFSLHQMVEAVGRAWMMGGNVALNTVQGIRVCRICGCWSLQACEPRCAWVADDLCSMCVPIQEQRRLGPVNCGLCRRPAGPLHTCQEC